jgi:uncharacterized membrane-anchored protein YitT (DUF2179 family)
MDFGTTLIAAMAIILGASAPIVVVCVVLWYKSRRTRLIHETALKLAERGQPVPPELFAVTEEPASDLRRGIVLSLVGLAICILLYQVNAPWAAGLIPFFMGVGYLIVWKLEGTSDRGKGDRSGPTL